VIHHPLNLGLGESVYDGVDSLRDVKAFDALLVLERHWGGRKVLAKARHVRELACSPDPTAMSPVLRRFDAGVYRIATLSFLFPCVAFPEALGSAFERLFLFTTRSP
jgi:hypothetical protein